MDIKPCLLLDFDGVIVDSKYKTHKNLNDACRLAGFQKVFSMAEFLAFSDKNFFQAINEAGISIEQLKSINDIWMKLMRDDLALMFPVYGIKAMIDRLSADYQIFLVTSNFKEVIMPFCDNNGLHCFDGIFDASHERSKVKKIQSIVDCNKKDKVIFVTDTKGDILEGREAGAICVGVSWGYHTKKKLMEAEPDHIFGNVMDLTLFLEDFLVR